MELCLAYTRPAVTMGVIIGVAVAGGALSYQAGAADTRGTGIRV